jgi:Protein of unknown function (DUF1761)
MEIKHIHWLTVGVLTILSFAFGMLWHQNYLFGKIWKEENKATFVDKSKINFPLIFGGTALLHFIGLAGLDAITVQKGGLNGLLTGLFVGIVCVMPAMGGTYLFANRSLRILAIDAGMYIVLFALSGLIMGIW